MVAILCRVARRPDASPRGSLAIPWACILCAPPRTALDTEASSAYVVHDLPGEASGTQGEKNCGIAVPESLPCRSYTAGTPGIHGNGARAAGGHNERNEGTIDAKSSRVQAALRA